MKPENEITDVIFQSRPDLIRQPDHNLIKAKNFFFNYSIVKYMKICWRIFLNAYQGFVFKNASKLLDNQRRIESKRNKTTDSTDIKRDNKNFFFYDMFIKNHI